MNLAAMWDGAESTEMLWDNAESQVRLSAQLPHFGCSGCQGTLMMELKSSCRDRVG